MKKFFLLFFISFLVSFTGFAQFPHGLMPGPGSSDAYGDSLLNPREILQKAGIKKIYTHNYQTAPEKLRTYESQTSMINENGQVESVSTCFPKNEHIPQWCNSDTVLYDDKGRIREIKHRDSKGYEYSRVQYEFISEGELKYVQIIKLQNKERVDTLVDYRYFNKKGQMIKLIQIRKDRPAESSLYYYNTDGLLDSVQYDNPHLPTIVYKRTVKGNKKIIEAQIQISKFKWVFNQSGQCTSIEVASTYPPRSNYTGTLKGETKFYYNPDGTLLKVSIKRSDKANSTMQYRYSK